MARRTRHLGNSTERGILHSARSWNRSPAILRVARRSISTPRITAAIRLRDVTHSIFAANNSLLLGYRHRIRGSLLRSRRILILSRTDDDHR